MTGDRPSDGDGRRGPGRPRGLVGRVQGVVQNVGDLLALGRVSPGTDPITVTAHRSEGNDAAVVLVHGFGVSERTFGDLPDVLSRERALEGWDVYSLGYDTGLLPDLRGLWSADPEIAVLATYLRSRAGLDPLGRHRALALVAHSMGGLVVQRALVDDPRLVRRTSHVVLFGTPSAGLDKARWGGFLKAQIRDMGTGSDFLVDLRHRWEDRFGEDRPFRFWTVAGDRDVFVPASSSLGPFPVETQIVTPGNHLEICQARSADEMGVQVLIDALAGQTPGGPWNSARVAVERREFHRAVELLLPHADELDEAHLVALALALDETDRRETAIEVLRRHGEGTDARGTLAGRLKRSWMAEGRQAEGEQALTLYAEAYHESSEAGADAQAAYHGVNRAFFELVLRGDRAEAARWAERVLDHCARSPEDYWRAATEAEADLYLGDLDAALSGYRRALTHEPSPRMLGSTYLQASWVASELGDRDLVAGIEEVFGEAGRP